MRYPNLQIEKQLWAQGYKYIAGLDEAGRGAWAGPIVAGAVILDPAKKISGLRDSKLLSAPARERLYEKITKKAIAFGAGIIGHEIIDAQGLQFANCLAMQTALRALAIQPDYLLIDALKIDYRDLPRQSVVDGDYRIASIAAASIIAKVSRDKLLKKLADEFPQYGFAQHKGYGTKMHYQMICKHGVCRVHRQSFEPIKNLLK